MNESAAHPLLAVNPLGVQSPAFRPSARSLWIRDQLLAIHPGQVQKGIEAGINDLVQKFEHDPVAAMVWWCRNVPKKLFQEKHRLDVWVDLLRHCLNLHVVKNYKRQPKKPGWMERALKGLFNTARRLGKANSDVEDLWETFLSGLLREARYDLDCNPLTKILFQPPLPPEKRRKHFDQFKRLGKFLKGTNPRIEIWKGDQDFILSLVSDLNQPELKKLLSNSLNERKIAMTAIRSDLKAQQAEYMRLMDIRTPARETLRRLIMQLGDSDLAIRADQELGQLLPTGLNFNDLLVLQRKDHEKEDRRPDAKRRYKRRSQEGH